MKQKMFIDKNNQTLIVEYRKSAVFLFGIADINKPNKYGSRHEEYICGTELSKRFAFSNETFKEIISFFKEITNVCWKDFKSLEADSFFSDYDDYYDREFDNNGHLSVKKNGFSIGGAYTQLKSNGEKIRFIKFNKRTFASFIFDLEKLEATK